MGYFKSDGKFIYLDPKDGVYKEGYGVIADTICSNLILSEEVGIYNPDSSIVINKDGISVSDPKNTSSNKPSVTITPDGKLTCNGATISGDITANSLTLTPNAIGDVVDAKVVEINNDTKQIGLSMKALMAPVEEEEAAPAEEETPASYTEDSSFTLGDILDAE